MFDESMEGMITTLLKTSKPSGGLVYVGEDHGDDGIQPTMHHLACFLPSVLALGAVTSPRGGKEDEDLVRRDKYMNTAKGLVYTCYQMYQRQPTHLSPDDVYFSGRKGMEIGEDNAYILRPETVESLVSSKQIVNSYNRYY